MATTTPATVPLVHRSLGIGLSAMATMILVLYYLGRAPLLQPDSGPPVIAYALTAIDVVIAVVALFVFRPRVPDRQPGQSVDQYWSAREVGAKVLPVWFLLEGAGMLGAIGFWLTGEPGSAIAAGLTIAAFWLCGPNPFASR